MWRNVEPGGRVVCLLVRSCCQRIYLGVWDGGSEFALRPLVRVTELMLRWGVQEGERIRG